jgi:hypothetical protein
MSYRVKPRAPARDLRSWCRVFCLVGIAMLAGCSTFVSNEKRSQESFAPASSLAIAFVENPNMMGTLATLTDRGTKVKDWSKQQEQVKRDVPVMLSLARKGLLEDLKPRLEARKLSVAIEAPTQPAGISLTIKPKRYFVECGAGSVICQTSITFEVLLTDSKLSAPVWSADFKTGALLGMEQTEAFSKDFYRSVVERLVSAKVIL